MNDTEKALKTWYKENNPKHFDLLHPVLKLAGEAGELLDLYAKHLFKPGRDWEQVGDDGLKQRDSELGDNSYYLRILEYIQKSGKTPTIKADRLTRAIASFNFLAARIAYDITYGYQIGKIDIEALNARFQRILDAAGVEYDDIIQQNYWKLNEKDEDNHGWKDAK